MALVKTAKQDIADYLYPEPGSMESREGLAVGAPSNLSLNFDGWLEPYLTDPQGRKAGLNPDSGLAEYGIPGITMETEVQRGYIAIDNPVDGTYTITLKGRYPGGYHLSLCLQTPEATPVIQEIRGYLGTAPVSFTIQVVAGGITLIPPVVSPTNLQANPIYDNGLLTALTWTASNDPEVVSYEVYSQDLDSGSFTLLGTTTETTFITNLPWAATGDIKSVTFVVVAVKADGTKSFFSNAAINNDRDHDGISDAGELKYGTDPEKTDTDGDGYTDGQEYLGGSNPLDPNSVPPPKGNITPILHLLLGD